MSDTLGTYGGAGPDALPRIVAFEKWLNRPVRAIDFFARETWGSMLSSAAWSLNYGWSRQSRPVVFTVPLLTDDHKYDLKAVASGAFNQTFTQLGDLLVRYGQSSAILRVGHEFNGGWYPWAPGQAPGGARVNAPLYAEGFRQAVTSLRAAVGSSFRFDWCPALGWNQFPWVDAWPGSSFVDIIGMDTYNQWWTEADRDPATRWNSLVNQMYGLKDHMNFAAAVHKKISFPEWATGTRPDGHGGGDDPLFINNMTQWIRSHNVIYHNYWNFPASDFNCELKNFPQSAIAFKNLWGMP